MRVAPDEPVFAALSLGGNLGDVRAAFRFALERLALAPPPLLLDPLTALNHLGRRSLSEPELVSWRCGRALVDGEGHAAETAVAVVAGDGNLAGIARADGSGLLQPRLVFAATG